MPTPSLGLWAGRTGKPEDMNETTQHLPGELGQVFITLNHTTLYDPGRAVRLWQKVQRSATDGTTLETNGGPAFIASLDDFQVTQDESDQVGGTGSGNVVGVFFNNTLTDGSFGFIGVGGSLPCRIVTATTPAIGDTITPSTTDGQAAATADFGTITEKPFGTVLSLKNAGSIGTHVVEALIQPSVSVWQR